MAGTDGRFFQTTKKGEMHELKTQLNANSRDKIKDAVKKTIAAMTVGKDVSALFTDVVKSMQTGDIELKKLVYLYIINYARSQPDKAILVVNTFQRDASDSSPLVRGLAIRTMGCIRVDRITEYLCEPLAKALQDKHPYVRKTAAVCTAKLYDINAELVEEQGFMESLRNLIADPNPVVVANAVAALAEIAESSGQDVFRINSGMLAKLLAALSECTEWGQVFILDCLAKYEPTPSEAEEIIERVTPRLKHANSSVALSAIKVMFRYLSFLDNPELEKKVLVEKLPPPLITLLAEDKPEIQYVALRNINIIVQLQPNILANQVKHFFCKYTDPTYVKMEKLEIIMFLVNVKTVEKVLMELKEYASEVDVDFVRKSIRCIGRCAIKIDKAAERCIRVLLDLIQTKVNYAVQEAVIVVKDIFRKYPNRYESIISTLCSHLDVLDDAEAKASMIWIIGEYSDRIDNAPELLQSFLDTFEDEEAEVQLQLLTGVVKLFLKRPDDAKDMVTEILKQATENINNADLRDRGYIYWRLLSTDPDAAQAVVLSKKPAITDVGTLSQEFLNSLTPYIGTLASVHHRPPSHFIKGAKSGLALKSHSVNQDSDSGSGSSSESESSEDEEEQRARKKKTSSKKKGGSEDVSTPAPAKPDSPPKAQEVDLLDDLLGFGVPSTSNASKSSTTTPSSLDDMFAPSSAQSSTSLSPTPLSPFHTILSSTDGKGLQVSVYFSRKNGAPTMHLKFDNQGSTPLSGFAIKFNSNQAGLAPAAALKVNPVQPCQSAVTELRLKEDGPTGGKPGILQVAIKTSAGVSYCSDDLPAYCLFSEDGLLPKKTFLEMWRSLPSQDERTAELTAGVWQDSKSVQDKLAPFNIFHIASPGIKNMGQIIYLSFRFKGEVMLVEVTLNGNECKASIKSKNPTLAEVALASIKTLLASR